MEAYPSNGVNGYSGTNGHGTSTPMAKPTKVAMSPVIWESDSSASFLRAARSGNADKVLEFIRNGTDINTCNQNGLNALHLASKEGHEHIVRELLTRGATVDAVTRKGNAAIHVASLAGQEEVVRLLVQAGANVNAQSQNGFTPLYMAAQESHDTVVRYLLANGANQSIATEDGFTPLAVALQQGHDKVVTVLLENDTRGKVRLPALHIAAKKDDCKSALLLLQNDHNPDVTSRSGFTPLHIAAHYGNQNMANLLLDKGADINCMAKHNITPLHVAAKWGRSDLVVLLCGRGAGLECRTRDGLTPLHCAARSGHDNVIDTLLNKTACISSKTKNGLTPLHMAAQGDHVDAARILLFHKAPVDDVTVDYLTALHVSAHCGHVKVAKLLLDRQADANSRALNGFTPLHIACKKNRIEVVELLLKHGASIEATTESGLTPLHVASFMGCMDIVVYLLQHDARVDHPTVRGETPLHLAARANQTDIIRILLRNQAHVDTTAREQQTPLHIAARLGNADIVMLLLQHGAAVDATTKDMYTALHIAAKEAQEEVALVLLDNGASLSSVTMKGFTPLHLSAKYGSLGVAKVLLARGADTDAEGKNGVTPLHVASHYDHQKVALLLLEKGASVKATAKNGYTPLHIAAKKNQMEIATTLLEYGADSGCESRAGFTPLHLASQDGHADIVTLLVAHGSDVNATASNGLRPLHLAAQEDRVPVAAILIKNGALVSPTTSAGYTPLHVAAHFGQINMVRFLLQHQAEVNPINSAGYTPLHQAAQQGHTVVISLLLQHKAMPDATTNTGQTALSIAQRLGYISVVETLKVVTETTVTINTSTVTEHKYRVLAPESMHETLLSDSEDEAVEEPAVTDSAYKYLTVDEMKSLGDDSMPMDTSRDETLDRSRDFSSDWVNTAPSIEEMVTAQRMKDVYARFSGGFAPDNVDISRTPVTAGFLVSFMVDARGGAMRGCRHSGVRVIVPPRKAAEPMRITCRYLKKDKLLHPPPLMEGEAIASRILEMGPSQAKFLGPVIIEVPHFASLRGREREIVVLRSDNGETWKEHTLEASEEAVQEVLNESFDGNELKLLEDLNTNRITRILTTDFPQYFAVVSRLRQEVHAIGPEGGMVSSVVVPQVQAVFPPGALTKKIKVGLQAQPVSTDLITKMLGNRVAVSPIVTVEPRRRKFHKPITLTIPVPQASSKGMINQYSGDAPTLRLLCSITGGSTRAQWEDVTGSTPLTFVSDCVSFTTTVSARFWLVDCRNIAEATSMASELYREANQVPFMAKFVVFAKRHDPLEGRVRIFCMTDDKEDKTLEHQEHFKEVAKSRDVEVLDGKPLFLEFGGNLVPVAKSGDQLSLLFRSFRENRLPFNMRVKDHTQEPMGRVAFMKDKKVSRLDVPQTPLCNLNVQLPTEICPEASISMDSDVVLRHRTCSANSLRHAGRIVKPEIHRADIRIGDIAQQLGEDWISLASKLGMPESDVELIVSEYPDAVSQQATVLLRLWMTNAGRDATGNTLAESLHAIGRDDIVSSCITDSVMVTDAMEAVVAKQRISQSEVDSARPDSVAPDSQRDSSAPDIVKEQQGSGAPDIVDKISDTRQICRQMGDVLIEDVKDGQIISRTPSEDVDESKYAGEEKPPRLEQELERQDSPASPASPPLSPPPQTAEPSPSVSERSPSTEEPSKSTVEPSPSTAEPSTPTAEPSPSTAEPSTPTAAPSFPPEPRPRRARPVITPRDGPQTGVVVVSAVLSRKSADQEQDEEVVEAERVRRPDLVEALEADSRRKWEEGLQDRPLMLQQLGEALEDLERAQPPLAPNPRLLETSQLTSSIDGDTVEAPMVATQRDRRAVVSVSVLLEPLSTGNNDTSSITTTVSSAGPRQSSAEAAEPLHSEGDRPHSGDKQTATPPPSPSDPPANRIADAVSTSVDHQVRNISTEDGVLVQATTVTTTRVGGTAEPLLSEGDLQIAEMAHGGGQSENLEPAFPYIQTSGSDAVSAEEANLPRISRTDTASVLSARKAQSDHSSPGYPLSNPRLSSGSSIASSEDVLEHVLHPEVIVGTPEAENYFRDQSHRLRNHVLRGDMDIDVDDLDAIPPESGLYVLSDPTQLSQAADVAHQQGPISSSFERLYDNVRLEDVRGDMYLESKDFEGKLGDKFSTRTFPRGSSYEDLYSGLAPSGETLQVEEGFKGLLVQDSRLSVDAFPKDSNPSVRDQPCTDQRSCFVEVDKDDTLTSDMVGDDDTNDVDAASRIDLLAGDFPTPESSCVQQEPVVSSPDQRRRSAVRRHVTFHHSPRLTVTDNDDVRDVSEQCCNVLVVEPDDDDVEGSVVVEVNISEDSGSSPQSPPVLPD